MEITVNSIIEELTNRGFIVSEQTCIKNGIEKKGVSVKKSEEDRIAPTLYLEEIVRDAEEKNLSLSEAVDRLVSLVSKEFTFDIDKLFSSDYIESHIRIGVQKEGTENLLKRTSSFEGIEEYLYIADENEGEGFSIKLKPEMAEKAGLSMEYLFEVAEKNNHEEFTAKPLMDIISQMIGGETIPEDEVAPMYVLSNKSNIKGASAMLDSGEMDTFKYVQNQFMRLLIKRAGSLKEAIPYAIGRKKLEDIGIHNEFEKELKIMRYDAPLKLLSTNNDA